MIQAEVGGAARVDPGIGAQRPGFMIRDFTIVSNGGEAIRISSLRGQSNLAVVFLGQSDAMRIFLHDVEQYGREEYAIPIESSSRFLVLYDKTHAVYQLSGATDENGRPVPLLYLTDRFGEIVSTYVAPGHSMPPKVAEILSTLDFVNQQCPECEPPEWPR
jgi:hypothetical protein